MNIVGSCNNTPLAPNTPITASDIETQVKDQSPLSDAQNKTSRVVKEVLLEVKHPYSKIELPCHLLNDKPLHLYPSAKVLKKLANIVKRDLNPYHAHAYLERKFRNESLNVSNDTTLYYDDEEIISRVFVIKNNNIYSINNYPLLDNEYIFIIDQLGRLLIDVKRKTLAGRIQHTSLSQGKPVLAAGAMIVETNGKTGMREVIIGNCSGHYHPPAENLHHLEKLFVSAYFKKESDESKFDPEMKGIRRQITFKVLLS